MSCSGKFLRYFRFRHGLSQARLAAALGIPTKHVVEWEQDRRHAESGVIGKITDLTANLDPELVNGLTRSVIRSGLPRALCRSEKLTLQALSGPAIDKRPSIVKLIGKDLAPLASDVLEEMMADAALQRAIRQREVVGVVSTTRSVLRTVESESVGTFRTSISYFYHDGVRYSDAVAVPVPDDERLGYTPIVPEEMGVDLFGDLDALAAGVAVQTHRTRCA